MELKMKHLINCFEAAKKQGAKYIGIKIEVNGCKEPEIIINSMANFTQKLGYYKNAYDYNLKHKSAENIRIVGFTHSFSFDEIEKDLMDK